MRSRGCGTPNAPSLHRAVGAACCCFLHIKNHSGLSIQYLLLSQPLRTNPTLEQDCWDACEENVADPEAQDGEAWCGLGTPFR